MLNTKIEKAVFGLYDLLWKALIPFLRRSKRLREGFQQRKLADANPMQADLWIQSASVGEAYLAWELLKKLRPENALRVVLTTNTSQGLDILNQAVQELSKSASKVVAWTRYFPFDGPTIMRKAAQHMQPKLVLLLETEIWPGLLYTMKQAQCPVVLVNGRVTPQSLGAYMLWRSLWYRLRPQRILAVSADNADRFAKLFGPSRVGVMANMKFDRLGVAIDASQSHANLDKILVPGAPFLVLGSIRQPEEKDVAKIIREIHRRRPQVTIGLFPRHMQRLDYWQRILNRLQVSWSLRSRLKEPAPKGSVILWDIFGELNTAYGKAQAAFIGGSLAPLGGQNFLEPLLNGVSPVIGPYWDNFKWVGPEIMDTAIVLQASSWIEVADLLIEGLTNPLDREWVIQKAKTYVKDRRGGTREVCRLIDDYLRNGRSYETIA